MSDGPPSCAKGAAFPGPAERDPSDRRVRVGIDIGGTKLDAIALSWTGESIARYRSSTVRGIDGILAGIRAAVSELGAIGGFEQEAVRSIGIGMPGLIDPASGIVRHAVNVDVHGVDLARAATSALGVRVRVENDVKAAALGASSLRAGRDDIAFLNLGTGVAAGIVIGGVIRQGIGGGAGEIGHLSVDPLGRDCACGQRGCIETMCGGGALAKAWGRPSRHPVREILDAAAAGDEEAQALRDDLFRGVAAAVRALVLTVDVDSVVIGGGLANLGDRLLDGVRTSLRHDAESSPFLRSLHLYERIELLPVDSAVAAIGAALVGSSAPIEDPVPHG